MHKYDNVLVLYLYVIFRNIAVSLISARRDDKSVSRLLWKTKGVVLFLSAVKQSRGKWDVKLPLAHG